MENNYHNYQFFLRNLNCIIFAEKIVNPSTGIDVAECNNYITSISRVNQSHFEFCATNAGLPKLSVYSVAGDGQFSSTDSSSADRVCPSSRTSSSISDHFDGVRYTAIGSDRRIGFHESRISMESNDRQISQSVGKTRLSNYTIK